MKYTTNKNLKLPEYTDVADVADLNENFEAIDEHMGETVTSENGAHGFRYDEENQKLEAKTSTGEWEEISLGVGVSGVTATADKVLAGSKFVTADGVLTDGTMENKASGGGSISTVTQTISIPKGYYDGSGSVSISSSEQEKIIPENIAEGITVLGVTGIHSGGLKMVTGSTTLSLSSSSYDLPKITISSPGIKTKYALFNILSHINYSNSKAMVWYDLTNIFNTFEVPSFSYSGTFAYINGWYGKPYPDAISVSSQCSNTADSLSIPFCRIATGTSSFSWSPVITYVLFGE